MNQQKSAEIRDSLRESAEICFQIVHFLGYSAETLKIMTSIIIINFFRMHHTLKRNLTKLNWFRFGKKKIRNLKSSCLRYFIKKKSKCKFKYGLSIVSCKKKQNFSI